MGNSIKRELGKRRKKHGCKSDSHCCRCECIEPITKWNSIEQVSCDWFKWQFDENHQNSLLFVLKHFNLETLMHIFKDYLLNDITYNQNERHPICCHANIWKTRSMKLCKHWLHSRSFYKNEEVLNITMLGSGCAGKRSLCRSWINGGIWNSEYDPTIEDMQRKTIQFTFNDEPIIFENVDVGNITYAVIDSIMDCDNYGATYDYRIRTGQIFFICFSWSSTSSFKTVQDILKKIERIRDPKHDKNYRFAVIMVGCKCDLKNSDVKMKNVLEIINKWNIPYVETSALKNINIDILFKLAVHEYWVQTNCDSIKWQINVID
eukprot:201261_1